MDFYSTAAPLLVVLLLSGALGEVGVLRDLEPGERKSWGIWFLGVFVVVALACVVGDFVALGVLAQGHANHTSRAIVLSALGVASVAVVGLTVIVTLRLTLGNKASKKFNSLAAKTLAGVVSLAVCVGVFEALSSATSGLLNRLFPLPKIPKRLPSPPSGQGSLAAFAAAYVAASARAPGAPRDVTAITRNGRVTVTWQPALAGGLPISYQIVPSPACPACSGLKITASSLGGGSTVIAHLRPSKTYTFSVVASNRVGRGPSSPPSNATTG